MLKAKILLAVLFLMSTAKSLANEKASYFPIQSVVGVEKIRSNLIEIKTEIVYPNGCYKPDAYFGEVDSTTATIYLSHRVTKRNEFCVQRIVQTLPSFVINEELNGTFRIVDKATLRLIGELEIDNL